MPIIRMASEILCFHLPKILFLTLQLKLIGVVQRQAQKDAKHKKLLNLVCIVYNVVKFSHGHAPSSHKINNVL